MEGAAGGGSLIWRDPDSGEASELAQRRAVQAQWKADWAMRWYALDVDYEMSGKDLIESSDFSSHVPHPRWRAAGRLHL